MRVQLNDPDLLPSLVGALARAGCVAAVRADGTCSVVYPVALDEREARTEVAFFVKAWATTRRGVFARLVD